MVLCVPIELSVSSILLPRKAMARSPDAQHSPGKLSSTCVVEQSAAVPEPTKVEELTPSRLSTATTLVLGQHLLESPDRRSISGFTDSSTGLTVQFAQLTLAEKQDVQHKQTRSDSPCTPPPHRINVSPFGSPPSGYLSPEPPRRPEKRRRVVPLSAGSLKALGVELALSEGPSMRDYLRSRALDTNHERPSPDSLSPNRGSTGQGQSSDDRPEPCWSPSTPQRALKRRRSNSSKS